MRRSLLIASVVLALAGAASAIVTSASRRELSQGVTFEVGGTDFVRPVRAWLEMEDRRIPLRVLRGATPTTFTAQLVTFRRGLHGECQLVVKTKGSKIPAYFGGMSIELPVVAEVTPFVAPGFEATITGTFFGTRRPKVYVADVRAKVTAWSDTSITIIVPPGTALGDQFLDVETRAGIAEPRSTIVVGSN